MPKTRRSKTSNKKRTCKNFCRSVYVPLEQKIGKRESKKFCAQEIKKIKDRFRKSGKKMTKEDKQKLTNFIKVFCKPDKKMQKENCIFLEDHCNRTYCNKGCKGLSEYYDMKIQKDGYLKTLKPSLKEKLTNLGAESYCLEMTDEIVREL